MYTDGHTPSLHDVLPISAPAPAPVESASPEPATPEMADDELNLEAENIMQPEAEAVAELTPTPVEEPVQQARITPLRSEPEAKAPPAERDWIAQPSARPADRKSTRLNSSH